MVGDGINDVLALKAADLGIAMGSRTAAARAVAQLVLLDDSFTALPSVIAEGRRVIANIETNWKPLPGQDLLCSADGSGGGGCRCRVPVPTTSFEYCRGTDYRNPWILSRTGTQQYAGAPGLSCASCAFRFPPVALHPEPRLLPMPLHANSIPDLDLARTAATLTLSASGLSILTFLARASTPWQRLLLAGMVAALGIVVAVPRSCARFSRSSFLH